MTGTMPRRKRPRRYPMTAKQFKAIRALTAMTQAELAHYMDTSRISVGHYEQGNRPIPGPVAFIMRLLEKEYRR